MRRSLLALVASAILVCPATAADLYRRKPTPYYAGPPPAFDWTGIYLGGHVGWGWGKKGYLNPAAPGWSLHQDYDGFLGGGQIGLNYQMDDWVVGLEGDFSGASLNGSKADPLVAAATYGVDVNWLATVTARVGYDVGGLMIYGKGGAAWVDESLTWTAGANSAKASTTRTGWTVGGGLELALSQHWSTRLEYNYLYFGHDDAVYTGSVAPFTRAVEQEAHAVKFGVNYRFAPVAPVVRRY